MSMNNRATLIGYLGKDPEIKTMNNGNKVATFSIATSKRWKDKTSGEQKEATEWHNIVVFNEALIGLCEKFLRKGSKAGIEGEIRTRKYQDKKGEDRWTTEIVLAQFGGEIMLLDAKDGSRPPAPSDDYGQARTEQKTEALNDEIPF
jgi:single-strand DNA-binding protein